MLKVVKLYIIAKNYSNFEYFSIERIAKFIIKLRNINYYFSNHADLKIK